MNKTIIILKLVFFISIIFLVVISLFPGSLIGYFLYHDLSKQPSMIDNTLGPTINHFIYYLYISLLGLFIYLNDLVFNKIVIFLFLLSFFLELVHLIIPNRAFEFLDFFANIFGVLTAYFLIKIYKNWRKKNE